MAEDLARQHAAATPAIFGDSPVADSGGVSASSNMVHQQTPHVSHSSQINIQDAPIPPGLLSLQRQLGNGSVMDLSNSPTTSDGTFKSLTPLFRAAEKRRQQQNLANRYAGDVIFPHQLFNATGSVAFGLRFADSNFGRISFIFFGGAVNFDTMKPACRKAFRFFLLYLHFVSSKGRAYGRLL